MSTTPKPKPKPAPKPRPKATPPARRRLTARQFYHAYMPYARDAMHRVNISWWVILSQWAIETGFGSSDLAVYGHNLAGIRWYGRPGQAQRGGETGKVGTGFAGYRSIDEFVDDYCHVMQLPYYAHIRELWDPHDDERVIAGQIAALGRSPWSGQHYGSPPGSHVLAVWHKSFRPLAAEAHANGRVA